MRVRWWLSDHEDNLPSASSLILFLLLIFLIENSLGIGLLIPRRVCLMTDLPFFWSSDFLVSLNCFMEELPRLALGLLFLDFRDPAKVDTTGLTATALLWFSFLTLGLMLFFESSISFPPLFLMTETSCGRVAITLLFSPSFGFGGHVYATGAALCFHNTLF